MRPSSVKERPLKERRKPRTGVGEDERGLEAMVIGEADEDLRERWKGGWTSEERGRGLERGMGKLMRNIERFGENRCPKMAVLSHYN